MLEKVEVWTCAEGWIKKGREKRKTTEKMYGHSEGGFAAVWCDRRRC